MSDVTPDPLAEVIYDALITPTMTMWEGRAHAHNIAAAVRSAGWEKRADVCEEVSTATDAWPLWQQRWWWLGRVVGTAGVCLLERDFPHWPKRHVARTLRAPDA